MSEEPRTGWQCPTCGRQVPRTVETCRCGSERRRLEALGYRFERAAPPPSVGSPAPVHVEHHGPLAAIAGHRPDTDLAPGWRVTLKAGIALVALLAGAATAQWAYTEPRPMRGNVQVLTTLDDFTRRADPAVGNVVPAFLSLPGRVGALATSGDAADPVRAVDEADLRLAFCSTDVARQVRHDYPGYYEDWADEELVRAVLEKHPDYAERVCSLSVRLDASADEIIKYELIPRTLAGHAGILLLALAATVLTGLAGANAYYRFIIMRFASPS